jgi:hypothetical protein
MRRQIGSIQVDKEIARNFKTNGPRDVSLLSNYNIDDVLKQWTLFFTDFYAYEFNMLDWDSTGTSLATVDIVEDIYNKGYRTFACVINSDVSTGRGKHWMALFGDMRVDAFTVEFFNSSGHRPQDEFFAWLEKAKTSMEKIRPTKIIQCCEREHQFSKTECGVYSLFYIWARLNGISYEFFKKFTISDILCMEFRQHLFEDKTKPSMENLI